MGTSIYIRSDEMNNTLLYLCITILIFWLTGLYFYWKGLKQYLKLTLSFPNSRNVICLVQKEEVNK